MVVWVDNRYNKGSDAEPLKRVAWVDNRYNKGSDAEPLKGTSHIAPTRQTSSSYTPLTYEGLPPHITVLMLKLKLTPQAWDLQTDVPAAGLIRR
eukprot:359787-Chlamydomonas_euryale.AAC.9